MRRRAWLAVLVLVPLAATACGSGGGSAAPSLGNLTPLAYVKHATGQTATGPERMKIKAEIDASGRQATFGGDGRFDLQRHLGTMHIDLDADSLSGSLDEIITGPAVYMKSSLFPSALLQGRTWVKLDLTKVAKARGLNYSALLAQDPSRSLGQLKGLVNVKKVGTEHVDGTTTTHFRGHLDLSKVPQAARLRLNGATFTPVDIWVGNDGYVRREKFGAAFVVPDGSDADLIMQIDYSDFGKPVDVSVPDGSEVLDLTSLAIPGLSG